MNASVRSRTAPTSSRASGHIVSATGSPCQSSSSIPASRVEMRNGAPRGGRAAEGRHPARRWLARQLIRRATRISTLSNYTQELLLSHFPEAADRIYLTPGALRSDFVVVPPKPTGRTGKIVVLTVGRLHPRKGQLLTLQALQMLPPDVRARIEYWVVGAQSKGHYELLLRSTAAAQPVMRFAASR